MSLKIKDIDHMLKARFNMPEEEKNRSNWGLYYDEIIHLFKILQLVDYEQATDSKEIS